MRRLKGLPVNFGYVSFEDRSDFIDFAIENSLLKFVRYLEYRGILGQYDVLEDFEFNTGREYEEGVKYWLTLHKGDGLELTEIIRDMDKLRPDGSIVHKIWTDVSDEERKKIYEM